MRFVPQVWRILLPGWTFLTLLSAGLSLVGWEHVAAQEEVVGDGVQGIGVLEVFVDGPADVSVEVDGEQVDYLARQLMLPSGIHHLVVSAPGYASYDVHISMVSGEILSVRVPALRPLPAMLWISSDVHDAEVWLDNAEVGTTSRQVVLMLETHATTERLRIGRRGYGEVSSQLQMVPGETRAFHLTLADSDEEDRLLLEARTVAEVMAWRGDDLRWGYVEVTASRAEQGSVWINEQSVGKIGEQIPCEPGIHRVRVDVPGFEPEEFEVDVVAGQAVRWNIESLRALPAVVHLRCELAGAEVWVDHSLVGRTPVGGAETTYEVPATSRSLRVVREGIGEQQWGLRVLNGEHVWAECGLNGSEFIVLGSAVTRCGSICSATDQVCVQTDPMVDARCRCREVGRIVGDDGHCVVGPAGEFVRIEPGRFRMGSNYPDNCGDCSDSGGHEVYVDVEITRAFFIHRYEVTQGQWRAVMGNNPSRFATCGDNCPIDSVSWFESAAYANVLSLMEGLQPCYVLTGCEGSPGDGQYQCRGSSFEGLDCTGYRLPTEAEWEYAARATSRGQRHGDLDSVAWHLGNSGGRTHPVGQKRANRWGLYDMLGNVREWTTQWYDDDASEADHGSRGGRDPVGPEASWANNRRSVRGGSMAGRHDQVRSGYRGALRPASRSENLGFRLVRTAPRELEQR